MSYESISLVEMDDFLRQRRFKPVDLYFRRRPVKEWVYERRLPQNANHYVRVYTTIQRYGGKTDQSRDVGKDAIRVQVIYRDEKGETLVSMPKRVNRVSTWRDNLDDRLKEIAESLPTVKMDRRGEPMTLRKKRGNLFWGSRDYPNYKETRRYGAETIRECCECQTQEGLTTIQAGTYCYDCLPINLGAEEKILCSNCNWSWNRSEGGDDLFICHKCGTDTQVFNAETDPVFAFRYMPESAYHKALEKGYMEPWGYHGATLATLDPTPTSYQTDGFYDGGHPLSDIYQIDLTGLRYRPHEGVRNQGEVILIEGNIPVDQIQPISFSYGAEDDYDATYGKAQAKIRRRLKNKIMKQNIMGTKANKWSARKSQELKRQYEKACEKAGLASYKGSKTAKQDDLSKWSKQKWTTASGKKSSVTGEPYFPEKAVAALKKRGLYTKAKQQKQKANQSNKNARYSDDIREVVGQFRAEYVNSNDPTIINILLLEWAMLTNETYDSITIQKGLADYIEEPPYDFVRHMQNQDLISLEPSARALVPAAFLYYLKDKDRDHWVNMKSRAIGYERYKYLKEKISDDHFWLSEVHKANYEQWLSRSAINYQNI